MTVYELIQELSEFNATAEVRVWVHGHVSPHESYAQIDEVEYGDTVRMPIIKLM